MSKTKRARSDKRKVHHSPFKIRRSPGEGWQGVWNKVLTFHQLSVTCLCVQFEWDANKEGSNIGKHGVDFHEAQSAFYDPHRIIAVDERHSVEEPRLFCIGKTRVGIVTVRFSYRRDAIRIIGAGYWRKGKQLYEKANR